MDPEKTIIIPIGDYKGIKYARDIPDLDIDGNIKVSAVNVMLKEKVVLTAFPIKFDEALNLLFKSPTLEELNDWIKQTPTAAIEHQKIIQILRDKGIFLLHNEDKAFEDKLMRKLFVVPSGKLSKTATSGVKELLSNCSEFVTLFEAVEKTSSAEGKHRNVYIKALNKDLRALIQNGTIIIYSK